MKRKLFFMCLFLTSVVAVKAQNVELIKNGNFEDGTNGWNLGKDFSRKGSTGDFYVETGDNLSQHNYPRLKTNGQTFGIAKGKKYTISYYVKGSNFNPENLSVNFSMADKDGNSVYKPSEEGYALTSLKLTKVGDENGWEYYEKEFTFHESVVFVKDIGFSITGTTGAERSNKAIKKISFKGEKVELLPAPKNLNYKDFQRELSLTWDRVSGYDKYLVEVYDEDKTKVLSKEVTGTSYMVTGLEIDKEYNVFVSVSSSGNAIVIPAKENIYTLYSDYDEADRIPYVLLDNVSNPFFVHVYDTNKPLTVNSVMVNGQVINANADGTYTLPTGANKTLKFFFSDTEGQKWEFEYKGVTVN